jgi:carboxyl-terminal processing protease
LAILIDGSSASASEIVSAALQDNGRAMIVGTRSYGKGTVQNILPLQYGRSALRLTVARYYRPSGVNIHRDKDATEEDAWGVSPNDGAMVELSPEALQGVAKRWREAAYPSLVGIATERVVPESEESESEEEIEDSQLARALELIREKTSATPAKTAA